MKKSILTIAVMFLCSSYTSPDWLTLTYQLSGHVYYNNTTLKSTSFDYFTCKSQTCKHSVNVNSDGYYSCLIEVTGTCKSSPIGGFPGNTFDEKYLNSCAQWNQDTILFYYNSKTFKMINPYKEIIREYLKGNVRSFLYSTDIKF